MKYCQFHVQSDGLCLTSISQAVLVRYAFNGQHYRLIGNSFCFNAYVADRNFYQMVDSYSVTGPGTVTVTGPGTVKEVVPAE